MKSSTKKVWRQFLPLPILIVTAYLGGLFFGLHPEYLRFFWGSTVVLGVSKDTKFLSNAAAEWLKNQSHREIEVRIIEEPSKVTLFGVDLLFLSSDEIKDLTSEFTPPSFEMRELADSTLVRQQDRSLPILWKLVPGKPGSYEVKRWMLADVSGRARNVSVLLSAMEREFHEHLLKENSTFLSSLKSASTEKDFSRLHETPLNELEF